MRLAGISLRGPAAGYWAREERREREAMFADALRAAEALAETRETIRQRMADERETRERERRRERRRAEHDARLSRIGGSRA